LEGNEGRVRKKWKREMKIIKDIERRGFRGLVFLQNIKSSSFKGTKHLYLRRVLGGLEEFI